MLNFTNNSNETSEVEKDPPFGYYSLFITLFYLIPATIINILLLVSIFTEKTIPGVIRLVLANIVLACEVVIVGLVMYFLSAVILSGLVHLPPSDTACRIIYIVIVSGGAARLLYMATFATTVYILVCHSTSKLKIIPTVVAMLILWIGATVPNLTIFSPTFFEITFHDDDDCAVHGVGPATYVYTFSYIVVYGLCSFAVSIAFPIYTVNYVKKNTITGDTKMTKSMIKFTTFLLIGNAMNFLGLSIPYLFATFTPSGEEYYTLEKAVNYTEGLCILVSLVPTPIFILTFFQPVRRRFKNLIKAPFCQLDRHENKAKPNISRNTPLTPSTGSMTV